MDQSKEDNHIVASREQNGVAIITINRPKALNSFTRSMMTRLAQVFKALGQDNSVKVIILTGSGRAFCSGVDLSAAEEVFKGDVKDMEIDPAAQMELCKQPIIGAINGLAIGGGFGMALACDILIAVKGAKFIDTHARASICTSVIYIMPCSILLRTGKIKHGNSSCMVAAFPSWGISQKLSRIIGPNRAREVSLTAMPVTAEQAERWGLVTHVVEEGELLNKAREVTENIVKNNQDLVLRYKSIINDGLKLDLGRALSLEKGRAHDYYHRMSKEHFKNMQEFIAARSSKKPSKL